MRIALVSEGTYPYAMGGVSIWCEQLIRGIADYRWEIVALTVDGSETPVFARPDNLDRVHSIPLWGTRSPVRRSGGRPGEAFTQPYEMFLRALVTPLDTVRSDQGTASRALFLLALRGLYEYAAGGGDLGAALVSNEAVTMMLDAWQELRVEHPPSAPKRPGFAGPSEGPGSGGGRAPSEGPGSGSGTAPTVADALQAGWLLEHMLRPLSAPVVEADIVHCSMNGLSTLVAMTAKWRHGTPLVMSEHGIYLRERYISYLHEDASHAVRVLALSFFRSLAGAAYLMADVLAPHSAYNRRWQLHNGADQDRMWTMYNGVEPAEFPAATAEPDVPTISFMGRVDPLKDLHTLIRAFAGVRREIPAARLRIFGGTPAVNRSYHESCQRLIDELGLGDAAVLEGRIGNAVDAYHAGSIVALTSISEGFPYTVVEAMACGRPTVCTQVGGVAEAVGDTGIVVPPRDHAAVAEACVKLLRDDELRHRLGAAARARVLEHFTLSQSLQMYRNVYEGLANPLTAAEAQGHVTAPAPAHLRHSALPVQRRPEDAGAAERPSPDGGAAERPAPDGGAAERPAPDGGAAEGSADVYVDAPVIAGGWQ